MEKQRLEILACGSEELREHWVTERLLERFCHYPCELWERLYDWGCIDDQELFADELKRLGFRRIYNYGGVSDEHLLGGVFVNRNAGLVVKLHYVDDALRHLPRLRTALLESPLYCPAILLSNGWEIQEWLRPAPYGWNGITPESLCRPEIWNFLVDQWDWEVLKPSLVKVLEAGASLIEYGLDEDVPSPGELGDLELLKLSGGVVMCLDFQLRNCRADRDGKLYIIDV